MEVIKVDSHSAKIRLLDDELLGVNNALALICYGIQIKDFEKYIGSSHEEVNKILKQIHLIIDEMKEKQRKNNG